jgi:hypothetical protein
MKHDARDLEIIANRKRFVHELRTTHEAQGRGRFQSLSGRYCAVGLYYYIVLGEDIQGFQLSSKVATHLGLSYNHLWMITGWNDGGCTFAEIADKFEKANFPVCKHPNIKAPHEANIANPIPEKFQLLLGELSSSLGELRPREEKEAGRITLEQWLERYGGDPKAFEHSA